MSMISNFCPMIKNAAVKAGTWGFGFNNVSNIIGLTVSFKIPTEYDCERIPRALVETYAMGLKGVGWWGAYNFATNYLPGLIMQKTNEVAQASFNYIQSNPGDSLGMGIGAGLLGKGIYDLIKAEPNKPWLASISEAAMSILEMSAGVGMMYAAYNSLELIDYI